MEVDVPDSLTPLETVGQFQQLLELAAASAELRNKVGAAPPVRLSVGV